MWRSHFVVLGEEPSATALAHVTDGYQLWRESSTGLYFLTAFAEPPGRRPDFSQFLDWHISHRIDLSSLERVISDHGNQVSMDLIQRAAALSEQLEMPVLAAEITDDDYGMAVAVADRVVTYLRFTTALNNAEVVEAVEAVYTPEAGLLIDQSPSLDVYGVGQKALHEIFGVPDITSTIIPNASRRVTRRKALRPNWVCQRKPS